MTLSLRAALVTALALTTAAPVLAQDAAPERVKAQLDAAQSRRMYIAVDKPLYYPGETVWFKVFEVYSKSLQPIQDGYGLTVQLLDPRGGIAQEKRVEFYGGQGHNDFALGEGLAGGEYVIVATSDTGTQAVRPVLVSTYEAPRIKKTVELERKAYGPGDRVAASVELERATGEPLAGVTFTAIANVDSAEVDRAEFTTDAEGEARVELQLPAQIERGEGLLTITVEDGGVIESTQKRIPITLDRLEIGLYPEGGDLVEGLPSRVYFLARTPLGKPADMTGELLEDGAPIATAESFHQGMGRFDVTPRAGATYTFRVTRPAGITTEVPLPTPLPAGCVMRSEDDDESASASIAVDVRCTEQTDVALTGVLREKLVAQTKGSVKPGNATRFELPMTGSEQGAVRVTLWNADTRPLAERLVYRGLNAGLQIEITADKESYAPREQVTLTIKVTDAEGEPLQTHLALSVVDDTVLNFADDKTAHILSALLLEPEMPGQTIEEPNFYFSDDPKAPRALDLLLGTQGWRRFSFEWSW